MTLEALVNDLRVAWRGVWRAKASSGAVIVTLALGMAGTTVMVALVQGVLLRPLPVRDQDRLLIAWKELRSSGFAHHQFGDAEIEAVGRATRLLERVAGVDANGGGREVLHERGESSYVKSALVTGDFFAVLGVEPVLGRALTSADDRDGAELVLVISHGLWTRRYAGAPDIIGRRVHLAEQPFTIVGVMPADLDYPNGVEVWRTTRSAPTGGPFGDAARREIDLVARMKPGVTLAQAASELAALTQHWEAAAPPTTTRGLVPVVRSLEAAIVGNVGRALVALLAAVGLVLLIATANVANLLSMRGDARRVELAVREALGAGRGRIVRQLLAESIGLTLAAAAVSLVLTWWSLGRIVGLIPDGLPRVESVRVDTTVVLFTIATALVASCLAALAPVLSSARIDLVSHLRGARGVTSPAAANGRRALVVGQIALAVTVVAAAGLLTRSMLRLQSVDVGLAADRLVFLDLSLPGHRYAERGRHAALLEAIVSRLEAVPGIAAATPVNAAPFSGDGGWDVPRFTAEGQSAERAAVNPSLNFESVHHNYFRTFQIPIVRGRAFTPTDREHTLDVAIVSADVAAQTWPGQDPIGRRLRIGGPQSSDPWRTIVGVAAPTRYRELARLRPTLYLPDAQFLITASRVVVRTAAPVDRIASAAREQIRAVDPDVPVMRVATFAELLDGPLARPRFNAFFLGVFGGVALLLATIGVYAVMAAYVRQRDREIGVRVALGATPARVRWLVLGEGLRLAAAGAIVGLAGAAGAARVVRGLLVAIEPLDPLSLAGAVLLLIAASLLASAIPLRRAVRIDPVVMLRSE